MGSGSLMVILEKTWSCCRLDEGRWEHRSPQPGYKYDIPMSESLHRGGVVLCVYSRENHMVGDWTNAVTRKRRAFSSENVISPEQIDTDIAKQALPPPVNITPITPSSRLQPLPRSTFPTITPFRSGDECSCPETSRICPAETLLSDPRRTPRSRRAASGR